MRVKADMEELFFSHSVRKYLNITYEDVIEYYQAYYGAVMAIKSLYAIVETSNHSNLIGGFLLLPPGTKL
jgi:hypothetical protein